MNLFDTLHSISSRLSELTNQLSTSKLSKEELAEFEALSRKIYERAVILNYKAKEEEVYGKSSDKEVNSVLSFSEEKEEVEVEHKTEPLAENYIEAIVNQHEIVEGGEDFQEEIIEEEQETEEEVETREQDSDSQIEETPEKVVVEEDGRVQFDFSGGFDTAKVEEKTTPEPESIIENQDDFEEEKDKDLESHQEEELKVEARESSSQNKEEEEFQDAINEGSIAQKEESMIKEQPSTSLDEVLQSNERDSDDKTASFYERFSKAYKAAAGDRLGTSKINSLKGAIGLNDRMLFINELFNGDSNAFNETIEKMDQLENNEIALRKLSEIAAKENWNKEDASVDEFAHLITRRYVD